MRILSPRQAAGIFAVLYFLLGLFFVSDGSVTQSICLGVGTGAAYVLGLLIPIRLRSMMEEMETYMEAMGLGRHR